MNDALPVVAIVLLPWLLGAAGLVALGLRPADDRLAFTGWAWICGALGTALVTGLWLAIGGRRGWPLGLDACLLLLGLGLAALGWRRGARLPAGAAPATTPAGGLARAERLFFALVTLAVLLGSLQQLLDADRLPVLDGDEAHFWAARAKLAYAAGGLGGDFAARLDGPPLVHHQDYPLFNPLLQVWVFAQSGGLTLVLHRLPMQLFAPALLLVLAAALRRTLRPGLAAGLLLVVAQCPVFVQGARSAFAELMTASGALLALDGWLRSCRSGEAAHARLAVVGLAVMAFAKHEGTLYLAALAMALLLLPRRGGCRAHPRALLWPSSLVALTWGLNAWNGFSNDIAIGDAREQSFPGLLLSQWRTHVGPILDYVARELLFAPQPAGLLPLVALLCGLLCWRRATRPDLGLPALAFALAALGLLAVFTGTPHDLAWHLGTAAQRVGFQLVPALALWLGTLLGEPRPADLSPNGWTSPTGCGAGYARWGVVKRTPARRRAAIRRAGPWSRLAISWDWMCTRTTSWWRMPSGGVRLRSCWGGCPRARPG